MVTERLAQSARLIAAHLDQRLADYPPSAVRMAMAWALTGGKALRGHLVLETAALYGIDTTQALPAAAAIEAIHAYSLVHDDLPAMDDDDMRRGRPTVHRQWDEPTAILAGDALQSLGFALIADADDLAPAIRLRLIGDLSQASGAAGMVLGQALDLAAEQAMTPYTLEEIARMQSLKTGALIEWSVCAGATLAAKPSTDLSTYARALGQAFQIGDDLLDVTGSAAETGKRVQKDSAAGKATFVGVLGVDGAKARGAALVAQAHDALSGFGREADGLRDLARFALERSK